MRLDIPTGSNFHDHLKKQITFYILILWNSIPHSYYSHMTYKEIHTRKCLFDTEFQAFLMGLFTVCA